MTLRNHLPLLLLAVLLMTSAAVGVTHAQTRLALEAGTLLPTGDMSDRIDASLWVGARVELQNVNPIGQVAAMSLVLRGGYADLQVDSGLESQLKQQGRDADASYFDVGLGVRVYSVALPFFLSVNGSYARYDAPDGDGLNAFTPSLGVGLNVGAAGIFVELEARGNVALVEDIKNQQFFTLTGAVGLPF